MNDSLKLKENGYLLKRGVLSSEQCDKILSLVEGKASVVNIPYSTVAWGYGNLLDESDAQFITDNKSIRDACTSWLGDDFEFNHLMINNKVAFIGPDVEWHQEEFNIDTFAPSDNVDENRWVNFLQIYIALDKHTIENGCLKIIPGSHELGLLPHEDMVNMNYSHKRRVPHSVMKKICEKHDIMNVEMSQGDVLFFVHRMLHASASNPSAQDRRSIVMQARRPFERSSGVYEREAEYRKSFIVSSLGDVISRITAKDIYNDFRKGKNEN